MTTTQQHNVKVHFLGASKTVTGSKYLVETPELNILIDCGMFQGLKELRERNWEDLPVDVTTIDIVLLTHGHLDHTGYLPRLLRQKFDGEIMGTAPTLEIARIILEDCARIHEEDAKRANEEGFTKHQPAQPFYSQKDVAYTLGFFKPVVDRNWISLSDNIQCRFVPVGHIIGATFIELDIYEKRFVFSGDVGRPVDYLLAPPEKPEWADYLFLESTYGDRLHDETPSEELIIKLVNQLVYEPGTLIIPSFAVERLQTLMYILWKLYKQNKIPNIPVYVDSPMGNNVLAVFERFPKWHKLSMADYNAMCNHINIVTSFKETWEVIDNPKSKIVIAGSGMVTGGRVLTYLKQLIDHKSTRILLVGYQAEGTRGRQLQEGVHEVKLYGKYYPVKAQVYQLQSLSAHADQAELLGWINEIKNIPEKVFLIHGEAGASDALRVKLQTENKWNIHIPELNEIVSLVV
ncbi:MBL fold metallo-hydrolase [Dokdonia sinensis]|uniref:MBL fold metallo-hydrolase n=1 Tax=Dokdonia sinensis TaxID=2479847 RepID=A0A3M0GMZ7_9FLAO|nr:MBL fold metallo-hydrolase [Dokdonia sinensis]RMB64102.1 MBL fold metallo-hydrolase [Dokdonia sinensis]